MNMIPSPLSLDLTNTRAFKTWLYQLWQSTGGTTTTATEDIDLYLATPAIDNGTAQLDQVLLMQIRDELSEINKKFDEIKINERTVLDDIGRKFDEIKINERTVLDDIGRKFDDVIILLGATL